MTAHTVDVEAENQKIRRSWAKQAKRYDKSIGFFERRVFGRSHRPWACQKATRNTLEVAIGTALNLPHYPEDVELTGIDLSPEMLEIARERSAELGKAVDLREGDAHNLPFDDESFDTVVCTYSLCNIPDPQRAVDEMKRVLKRGGRLILVDHIRATNKPVFFLQKVIEFLSARFEGEHMTRRPADQVAVAGFDIIEQDRMGVAGLVERLVAVKPR
ncbi:MAG: methyltransferase domain-containing protein [Actinomycetota bacterium]|nr:methyltransferase domain-containing protein [Actinomycetota bacterium]MDQ3956364.1 methyltransferase domain-containing protein [Actinomycetota bacterium]